MKSISRNYTIFLNLFVSIFIISLIYGLIETPPNFEDLDFYTGTIKHVRVGTDVGNKNIPIVLDINGSEKIINLRSDLTHNFLKTKEGSHATFGMWTGHSSFFSHKVETWHVEIDGVKVYDYKSRHDRTTKSRPYFFAIYMSILTFVIYIQVKHKNK